MYYDMTEYTCHSKWDLFEWVVFGSVEQSLIMPVPAAVWS